MASTLRVGVCQLEVGHDKEVNLANAKKSIEEAARSGAKLVVLPVIRNQVITKTVTLHVGML